MKTRVLSTEKTIDRKIPTEMFLKRRVGLSKDEGKSNKNILNDIIIDTDNNENTIQDYYCKNNYTDINTFQILMKLFYNTNINNLTDSQAEMETGTVQFPKRNNFFNFMKTDDLTKGAPCNIYYKKKIPIPFHKTFYHQKKNIYLFSNYFSNNKNYKTSIDNNTSSDQNKNDDSNNDMNEFNKGEQNFIIRGQIPSFVNILNFPEHFGNKMTPQMETIHQKYLNPIKEIKNYNKIKTNKKNNINSKKKFLSDNNVIKKNYKLQKEKKKLINTQHKKRLIHKKLNNNILRSKNNNFSSGNKYLVNVEKISHSEGKKMIISDRKSKKNYFNDDSEKLKKEEMNETTPLNIMHKTSKNNRQDKFQSEHTKKPNDIIALLKNMNNIPQNFLVCNKRNINFSSPIKSTLSKKKLQNTNKNDISNKSNKSNESNRNTINNHYKYNKLNCIKKNIQKNMVNEMKYSPSNIMKNLNRINNIQSKKNLIYNYNTASNSRNRSCKQIEMSTNTKTKYNKQKTLNRKIFNKNINNNIFLSKNSSNNIKNIANIINSSIKNNCLNTNISKQINISSCTRNKNKTTKKRNINYHTVIKSNNKSNNIKKTVINETNNINNTKDSNTTKNNININVTKITKDNRITKSNISKINTNTKININKEQLISYTSNNNRLNRENRLNSSSHNSNIEENFGSKQLTGESSTIINYTYSDIYGLPCENNENEEKIVENSEIFDKFDNNSENYSQNETILKESNDNNDYLSYQLNKNFTNAKKTINSKKKSSNNKSNANSNNLTNLKKSIFNDINKINNQRNLKSQNKIYEIFSLHQIDKYLDKITLLFLSSTNKNFYKKKRIKVYRHFYYKIIKDINKENNLLKIFRNIFKYSSLELILANNKNELNNKFEYYFRKIKSLYHEIIQKDISRTFPNDKTFDKTKKNKLFRILTCYSNFNSNIGYAQGLNFLAASSLYIFEKEEEVFLFIDALINKLELYNNLGIENKNLLYKMKYFSLLLNKYVPEIVNYLKSKLLNHEFFSAGWIITLFSNTMDKKKLFICWGFMIIFGWKFFFAFIIQVLIFYKNNIITLDERLLSDEMKTILNNQNFINDFNMIIKNTLIFMLEHITL